MPDRRHTDRRYLRKAVPSTTIGGWPCKSLILYPAYGKRYCLFYCAPSRIPTHSQFAGLRSIKLGENYSDRYAIVGFSAITESARLLCGLLQYKIDMFTIHNGEDVHDIVKKLKDDGCHMLLCDMIASTVAKELGLNAILITSGVESIENAFDQAVKLAQCYAKLNQSAAAKRLAISRTTLWRYLNQ